MIDPALGWRVVVANGINDAQQIVAAVTQGSAVRWVRLDLVSAVPEPGAYAMLLAGFALLGARRWRA
ncbi:MAG: PEP-CTERM sorting domain-containing protein [Telluria sp.]